jgi:hypothetical protein
MVDLLLFIAKNFGFLFESGRFRFVDSRVDGGSRGSAMVLIESPAVRLRITNHHREMLLEFQPTRGADDWFSLGLLRGVLVGSRGGSEVLDAAWAQFFAQSLDQLESDLGDPRRAPMLVQKLREQAELRADALFGTSGNGEA